jgi:hypothetical protein
LRRSANWGFEDADDAGEGEADDMGQADACTFDLAFASFGTVEA